MFDPKQAREDAEWARIQVLTQTKPGTEERGHFSRLSSYAEELVRLREGLVALRDEIADESHSLRSMLHCTESDAEYERDERDADEAQSNADKLTALLGEGETVGKAGAR